MLRSSYIGRSRLDPADPWPGSRRVKACGVMLAWSIPRGPARISVEPTSTIMFDLQPNFVGSRMSSSLHDALQAVADALEGVGDGWYLFGAQAALLRG